MKKFLLLMIVTLLLSPIRSLASENTVPSGMLVRDIEKTVDEIMDKYIGKEIPGAAISIVKDGEFVLLKGYGQSDIETKSPVDPEKTVFEAASVSKVYTWSAIMQLVEKGKLDLHEDIKEYLPKDYLNLEFNKKITLLDLMNHTAGFEDKAENLLTYQPEKLIPLKDFLTNKNQPKQVFEPGTVISYSNFGTSLAGYIIERISKRPFAEYMQEEILEKLQMENSTFEQEYDHMANILNNKSNGYEKQGDQFVPMERVYVNDAPAGSLNTTAKDMGNFMLAHLNKSQTGTYQLFEQKETLSTMHEQTYTVNPNLPGVAHGFWERFSGDNRVIEHSGNLVGFTSQLALVPDQNFGLSILTNVADEATGIRTDLITALVGEAEKPLQVSPSENDGVVQGTYRMARGIYSNFLSILPIISNGDIVVSENAKGGIDVKIPGEKETFQYTETNPFFYERVINHKTILDKSGMDTNQLAFEVDNEQKVTKMSFGIVSDFTSVKTIDRVSFNMILISICLLAFFLYTLFFLFNFIRRFIKARKEPVRKLSKGYVTAAILASTGTIVTLNIIILFVRFTSDNFQILSPLRIHLFVNWLLPLATIICTYFILKNLKQATPLSKVLQLFPVILCILFSIILSQFHFFF
ncbi:serine hydrolase domain-containing protein [Psychrobacillus sp. FSL K6-4615]|uniref:serine hydrolase domain-containing protein n=1 Tax=Psychrobacillus sp. FSL K6-4615 TaxID=2921551 RepID=UPI0030FB659B